jgi:Alpha-L-arabinofuranosidase C-terminal domain
LIVGDFSYHKVITDPFHFSGADSGITTLAAQQKILQFAKQHDREVWFDLHVWTENPEPDGSLPGMFSYIDALDKIADGAKHKVLIFELNANNHAQRRALSNALALNAIQRDGRLPITCSANSLQPDGQNDNSWDQGLLFLNPSQVWLQPPGYVTQLYSQNYQPIEVRSRVNDSNHDLDVSSQLSQDGKTLILKVINRGATVAATSLQIHGYAPAHPVVEVQELSGPLASANTAATPQQIQPVQKQWQPVFTNGETHCDFPPYSITVLKFE